jgi:hypothetical protein
MKKQITLIILCFTCLSGLNAQTFTDDFESYSVGSLLAASSNAWKTWTPNSSQEDVAITDADAASGTKSIYFFSNAASGGPQDIVLPFGGVYNTGTFVFSAKFKVDQGRNAYFNFQKTSTIGQVWAINCLMEENVLSFMDNATLFLEADYPDGWFELKIEINFSDNDWKVFVNNDLAGSFSNPENQVASLNLYPLEGSSFYVDDVSYTYTPPVSVKSNNVSSKTVALFPNPAADKTSVSLNLEKSTDVEISIHQINGSLIYKESHKNLSGLQSIPVNVSGLNTGIYFIHVNSANNSSKMKFIKH